MGYKINSTSKANSDIANSYEYYLEKVNKKVADNFFKDYVKAINKLRNSVFFEEIYQEYRRLPLSKYPFILIFKVDELAKEIKIYRVFHTSQNPNKYPK